MNLSSTHGEFPELIRTDARAVVDGNLVVFFIPMSEMRVTRPGFRLTAFGTGEAYNAEDSGGDVIGADPTEPLQTLPDESVPIEEVHENTATEG